MADYPAAHSQDTTWFAVDERGQVAVFTSYENGHVPEHVKDAEGFFDLCRLRFGEEWWRITSEERATRLGLFFYEYADGFSPISPYVRGREPAAPPMHVGQLPPGLREQARATPIPLRFDQAAQVQPLEWYFCRFWYRGQRVAYLAADGQTVRPVPGEEEQFAEFVRRFREEHPQQAENYRFEGPSE
jgi:hypothetical protein